jgi:hypothetical protein
MSGDEQPDASDMFELRARTWADADSTLTERSATMDLPVPFIDPREIWAFTFEMVGGGKITREGHTESEARAKVLAEASLTNSEGRLADRCRCETKTARIVRQAGFLVCDHRECAGLIF